MIAEAPLQLSLSTPKRLAITKKHLGGKRPRNLGPKTIMDLMNDVRSLQLDPTNLVAPSHLLVLWMPSSMGTKD